MPSTSSWVVSGVCICLILVLNKLRARITHSADSVNSHWDWIADDTRAETQRTPSSEKSVADEISENDLHRSLAGLGMAATSARQARVPKSTQGRGSVPHPATGNDEVADDVIRIQRVSEEEEATRYFAAFSSSR